MYERFVKRILDILLSLAGIIVLGLPMLIIALIIKLSSPGKVFFRQRRVGLGKSYFDILKFRTMRSDTPGDVPTHMLSDPARWITPIGAFLRKTSLDELPQLFNILKGEMSVIGPRPALWNQEDLIAERDKYGANDVKPGLTGWAQINGRDELPIPVKARLDGEYAKNISFAFDARCFFGTIVSVARHEGVVEGGTGELEKEKKHILVVSQYFYPEPFRIGDICAEWVKRGYKVTVVTGIPNYPYGKFYEGYGLFKKRRESYMGAEVIRLPIFPRGKSGLGMCLNYLSFVISGFFWKCFTPLRADMVFCFGLSPISMALPGVWFAKRRRLPCWLYVQDLWPESVEMVTGIHSRLIIAPIDRMVRRIYRRCDRIFTTSPAYVEKIREKLTASREKVSYWPQYAEEFYRPAERGECSLIPDDGRFKVIFTGNVGMAQGLDILPETAALLKKDGVRAEFVIVGDGRHKAALAEKIKELGTEDMFLLIPRQRAEDIPALLAQCDAAFVSFLDNDIFAATIPAKLQSYMACAMPILACAAGETERIVKEANCGVCSPIGDAKALCANVTALLASAELKTYGKNAREYFEAHFDKKTLLDYIDGCISQELERREEV